MVAHEGEAARKGFGSNKRDITLSGELKYEGRMCKGGGVRKDGLRYGGYQKVREAHASLTNRERDSGAKREKKRPLPRKSFIEIRPEGKGILVLAGKLRNRTVKFRG